MSVSRPLDDDLTQLESDLTGFLTDFSQPERLYSPIEYLLRLPAKRTRPMLALMGYRWQAPGADLRTVFPLAKAIEMFHNFTLVHDDIMDNAPERRGQPTIHARWNGSLAILAGDALLILAYRELNALHAHPRYGHLLEYFHETALRVCEGQVMDLDQAEAVSVKLEDYIEMIRRKTAVLLGSSIAMGALVAGAGPVEVAKLQVFGETAGVAFQLQDDYLDLYADQADFGKRIGGDIVEGKKNILWLLAQEAASDNERVEMRMRMADTEDSEAKIEWFREKYELWDVRKRAEALIDRHYLQAESLLMEFSKAEQQTDLVLFLNQLKRRKK